MFTSHWPIEHLYTYRYIVISIRITIEVNETRKQYTIKCKQRVGYWYNTVCATVTCLQNRNLDKQINKLQVHHKIVHIHIKSEHYNVFAMWLSNLYSTGIAKPNIWTSEIFKDFCQTQLASFIRAKKKKKEKSYDVDFGTSIVRQTLQIISGHI